MYDDSAIQRRNRGYLPHWEREGGTYFVTFRLADSLPAKVLEEIAQHKKTLAAANQSARVLLPVESVALQQLSRRKIEAYLDAGAGECLFKDTALAKIVADCLSFMDGNSYQQEAWCVMPNHVHTLFQLFEGEDLAETVGGWKSITCRQINSAIGRAGKLWQDDYFDRLIRDDQELMRAVEYIRDNPVKAGLLGWRWVYVRGK